MRFRLRWGRVWVVLFVAGGLLALPASPQAAPRKRVAVLEFRNRAGLDRTDLDYLVDAVVRGAVRKALPSDRYLLMTKESMIALLEDRGIRMEQVCEGSCEVDVGRKIGAHYIVTGSVWRVGKGLEVTIKLFDTKAGDLLAQETVPAADVPGLATPLGKVARGLVAGIAHAVPSGTTIPLFVSGRAAPTGPSEPAVTELEPTERARAASGPAGLYITTVPPGAEVYLGSVRAGATDPAFQKANLKAGTRLRVTLRKRDCHDKVFDVDLKPGVARYERVKLAPAFGTLVIESEPAGAKVTVGGKAVGTTPYRNERMPSGSYLVSVEKEIYRSVQDQAVEVRDGRTTSKRYTLVPEFGTLAVDSAPQGARVLVGGKERGRTPSEIRLEPGRYEVVVEKEGYRAKRFEVVVARGRRVEIGAARARLAKKLFSVNVFADPPLPGARILLDGEDTGRKAPDTLTGIPSGTHTLDVRTAKKGGKRQITGHDREALSVTVALKNLGMRMGTPGEVWKEPVTGMEFVWVPGGCYEMGCGDWSGECYGDEEPAHEVCVDGFWMSRYEVTQGQWKQVIGHNRSHFDRCGADCPVEMVSWKDAKRFIKKLTSMNKGHYRFRLPTEAEWEYACRSGGKPEKYAGGSDVDRVAWYRGNNGDRTEPVGKKASNGLGIHDMSGNVFEWCEDFYDSDAYEKHTQKNPIYDSGGSKRVIRGGSWHWSRRYVRCADRKNTLPDYRSNVLGFRVVRTK